MKNVHLLEAKQPCRLHYYNYLEHLGLSKENLQWKQGRNIYITSDELIPTKDGEWYFKKIRGSWNLFNYLPHKTTLENDVHFFSDCRKVILTTDQDLIKDGVQPIDDEFLEWFVKNPSCEEVKTNKIFEEHSTFDISYYKIIIPKEEPKQETIYEYTENYKPSFVDLTDILPKQETLEEVAEKIAVDSFMDIESGFSFEYSLHKLQKEFVIKAMISMAKWQQEQDKNKYSEEELRDMLQSYVEWAINGYGTYYDWFEQFKKK